MLNNVIHIEDAAQNLGSKIKSKNSCSIADITCTSFFPTKNLGGMVMEVRYLLTKERFTKNFTIEESWTKKIFIQ